ncbi:MAG: phosphoadenylyl-sulfate reductase [Candidatus Latescibacterota bacterium]
MAQVADGTGSDVSVEEANQRLERCLQEVDLEVMTPLGVLRWASSQFDGRAAISTSFQTTGMVMLHMAWEEGLDLRVATVDTLRLHPETYAFMREVAARYGRPLEVVQPDPGQVQRMVERFGEYLFFDSKEKQEYCCQVRKVRPHNELLRTLDCWITGLRRDQSSYRQDTTRKASLVSEYGTARRILKLAPLADWSEEEVRRYCQGHGVPVHPLYELGYPSFGCVICATPVRPGEPKRAGRWRWFNESRQSDAKECGLHYSI